MNLRSKETTNVRFFFSHNQQNLFLKKYTIRCICSKW